MNTSTIIPGDNDRRQFNQRQLQELADSIYQNGLAQPITIRPVTRDGQDLFEIVAGERRFRACSQILHWEAIPAIVRELNDEQADAIMLTENVHRVDLNPVDEGHAYQKRMNRHGWTISRVAHEANVSEGRVKNRLSLLTLRPEAQKLVADGHLSLGFAEEMSILDNNRQLIALRWLQEQKSIPSRRTFAEIAGHLFQEQSQESLFDLDSLFISQVSDLVEQKGNMVDMLPRLDNMPEVDRSSRTDGHLIDRYIADLLDSGREYEAKVLADFWSKSLACNGFRISPYESETLKRHPSFVSQ